MKVLQSSIRRKYQSNDKSIPKLVNTPTDNLRRIIADLDLENQELDRELCAAWDHTKKVMAQYEQRIRALESYAQTLRDLMKETPNPCESGVNTNQEFAQNAKGRDSV